MTSVFWSSDGERQVQALYRQILDTWPVQRTEVRVPTCEGETFILAAGATGAPPVVLLPGSMATSAMWVRSIGVWAADFRVYAVDLIGDAGLSSPARPSLKTDAHAKWLDDVLAALSLPSAHFVGASLGGLIAVDYAIRRPEKVRSLALMAPAGLGRVRWGFLARTAPLLFLGPWGHRRALNVDMGFGAQEHDPANREFLRLFKLVQQHFVARMTALPYFSDRSLKALKMPMMVVVGARDAVLDSAETRKRVEANVRNAEVMYLENAGHGLADCTREIYEFLRKQQPRTASTPLTGALP
jgi:pimeloyl-ACP methyl ester carboxylesterase